MRSNVILADSLMNVSTQRAEAVPLHVLTLTPFFPSLENEVSGCFVKEPLDFLQAERATSNVIAVSPIYYPRRRSSPQATAEWVRYPQFPGTIGLSSAGRWIDLRVRQLVSELHRRNRIDIIHAHGALPCGHAASLVAKRLKIPYVVTVHGLDVFNSCYVDGIAAEWRRRGSVGVYQGAAEVVCVSHKVKETLRKGMPSGVRSSVIYNGVDPELFSPDDAGDRWLFSEAGDRCRQEILVVGNLTASKGQELVLRAMHQISPDFPQLQCRVVGEGPDRTRLNELAAQLGIRERVEFITRQSRSEVSAAMRRCSVFVLPSRNEGLGCVYLEAMACGKPVIGCRGQGIEEVIEHAKNGWLVSPDDVGELAQALSTLLGSPQFASQIGVNARKTILDRFTLSHQAHNLATLYRAVTVLGAEPRAL